MALSMIGQTCFVCRVGTKSQDAGKRRLFAEECRISSEVGDEFRGHSGTVGVMSHIETCDNCGKQERVFFPKTMDEHFPPYQFVKSEDGSGRRYCSESCRREAEE